MPKLSRTVLIPPLLLTLFDLAAYAFKNMVPEQYRLYLLLGLGILTAVVYICAAVAISAANRKIGLAADNIFDEHAGTAAEIIGAVSVPCLLCRPDGTVVWRNEVMKKLCADENLKSIMPDFNFDAPAAAFTFEIRGGTYQVLSMSITEKTTNAPLIFQYWLDRTEAEHYRRLYEDRMPYAALVCVDNLEELTSERDFHRSNVLGQVEHLVSEMAKSGSGIYRKYAEGRYLVVMEAQGLRKLKENKFSILEEAKRIETGAGTALSLSIAVGVCETLEKSEEDARGALEMALGRGGDQAVLKQGANYETIGGNSQQDALQSRVKVRLFSKALRQMMENGGDVIVMGHRTPDMDCLGAALGVAFCAKSLGKRAFLVIDKPNVTVEATLDKIRNSRDYRDCIISPEHAEQLIRTNTVLVVVDNQRPSITMAPELLDRASRIVVVDHHRRTPDHIESPSLHYTDARSSSASEMITEVIQYFDDNLRPPAFICTALLAGITLDTKHFSTNVGSRTFEAAAFLRKNGADNNAVKQLFQDDLDTYVSCARTVESAELLAGAIALAEVAPHTEEPRLVAAKTADQLLDIRGIEAAIVFGRNGSTVSVSARSIGEVNVQLICEKLGGGGHFNQAGAQLPGELTSEEVRSRIADAVGSYLDEHLSEERPR